MSEHYLVVYPRGFIGISTPGLNKEINANTIQDNIVGMRYNNQPKIEDTSAAYNLNVTKMYKAMVDGIGTYDKMAFTKAVLIEAIRNFGGHDFSDWIKLQYNSRYFTTNHQKFILDTLKFITNGRRETSISTWEVVLRKTLIDHSESVTNNQKFNREVPLFFKTTGINGFPIGTNLQDVLIQWLSHRGGTEDLLLTLNIIFGKEFNK